MRFYLSFAAALVASAFSFGALNPGLADEPASAPASNGTVVAPGSTESASPADTIEYDAKDAPFLSSEWLKDFAAPPRVFRPLQIVHGRDLADIKTVEYFRDQCGLGGLVVNVGGEGYVRSDDNWARFVKGARNIKDAGMRMWIYDEDGYPSLAAGGAVLQGRPDLRAQELAFDPKHDPPYFVRDCYEFTHSSNNVFQARRYPNPLDPAATQRFLDVTHRRYRAELKDLYDYVEAFFTDEPSMMAANLGIIQEEHIRSRVPEIDPILKDKKCLPVVSWVYDLEDQYRAAYGESLRPNFKSLFEGDSEKDKRTRRNFWSLLGELDRKRYYEQIRDFCREDPNGPVASGHTLYEENIIMHVPLDGNKLEILKTFDLPGLDMLTSEPLMYYYGCWQAAAFPCSAATFIGKRRVMTEISDFSQLNSGDRQPANLETMESAAAWQAAFGVTEFNLYYNVGGAPYRNEETHRNYCRYVGRLNAVLRDAVPIRQVLLYYPIEEMQSEFKPVTEKYGVSNQSARAGELISSFEIIGNGLGRVQTSFDVVDRKTLQNLSKSPNDPDEAARLRGKFRGVIFPQGSEKIEYDWADPDFKVFRVSDEDAPKTWEDVARLFGDFTGPRLTPTPGYPSCIEGAFEREGRYVFLVANAVVEPAEVTFRLDGVDGVEFESQEWTKLDPKSGAVETFASDGSAITVKFPGRGAYLLVSPKRK